MSIVAKRSPISAAADHLCLLSVMKSLEDCVAAAERTVTLVKIDAETSFGFHVIGRDPVTISNVEPGNFIFCLHRPRPISVLAPRCVILNAAFCKGVLLIVIRCNEVTNFLIHSAGN